MLAGAFGAIVNYAWLKKQKGEDMTKQGSLKSLIIGAGVAVLVWLSYNGADSIYHIDFIGMEFWAGIGAETILGKAIGEYQMGKKVSLLLPLTPLCDPTEKKEEKKEEE